MTTTVAATGAAFKIREARFEDYGPIVSLQRRYGLGTRSYEDWSQMWLGNPLYRELRSRWPIGWVLEDRSGRIVASIGNIPLPYEWNGRPIIASSGISWVAEPGFRSASLLLLDSVVNQRGVDLYLNSTVTKEAEPAIEMFHCLRVPVGRWDERAFWVTNHRGFSASLLIKKGFPRLRFLSCVLGPASFLHERLSGQAGLQDTAEVECCAGFDERFDGFWEELRWQRRNQLLAVRSREVLNWHFGDSLRNGRLWIAAVAERGRLAAYAIFDRRDNPKYALKRVRLVDYQSLNGSEELLPSLLSWGLRRCRRTGVHMLENVGRWLEDGEIIAASAPHLRKLYAWSYFYRACQPWLAEHLQNPSAWSPSLFDGNASL
ncbi:MAG TPA: hypothetical protein VKT49_10170 [Bryobacteraceae bacterium]|nr:hypothetical protein [Bryobacteraceae bacterium]